MDRQQIKLYEFFIDLVEQGVFFLDYDKKYPTSLKMKTPFEARQQFQPNKKKYADTEHVSDF